MIALIPVPAQRTLETSVGLPVRGGSHRPAMILVTRGATLHRGVEDLLRHPLHGVMIDLAAGALPRRLVADETQAPLHPLVAGHADGTRRHPHDVRIVVVAENIVKDVGVIAGIVVIGGEGATPHQPAKVMGTSTVETERALVEDSWIVKCRRRIK